MNTALKSFPVELALGGEWIERSGGIWITPESPSPEEMARILGERHGRLITITAIELPDGEGIRLDYHWDLQGMLLSYTFHSEDNAIASIYGICEAADWIEREIHEYYAVEFSGRHCEPLFLRGEQTPGVNLREVDE